MPVDSLMKSAAAFSAFVDPAPIAVATSRSLLVREDWRPWVTAFEEPHDIEWLGRLGMPGVFDGRHSFTLTSMAAGRTLLQQAETFSVLHQFLSSG
ncbi:hypothetical protein [Janibacter sp. HTCC2649]|uniref:hypothetical protein n=1 Tax=Janibacter sp. HTCC2649 TaxID=313589 RepID=UPI0011D20B52|nr:hypothetical protein [Janibacter sp. HTCC2649]